MDENKNICHHIGYWLCRAFLSHCAAFYVSNVFSFFSSIILICLLFQWKSVYLYLISIKQKLIAWSNAFWKCWIQFHHFFFLLLEMYALITADNFRMKYITEHGKKYVVNMWTIFFFILCVHSNNPFDHFNRTHGHLNITFKAILLCKKKVMFQNEI